MLAIQSLAPARQAGWGPETVIGQRIAPQCGARRIVTFRSGAVNQFYISSPTFLHSLSARGDSEPALLLRSRRQHSILKQFEKKHAID